MAQTDNIDRPISAEQNNHLFVNLTSTLVGETKVEILCQSKQSNLQRLQTEEGAREDMANYFQHIF